MQVVSTALGVAGTVASIVSVFVMLNIKLAIANLRADILEQRRVDEESIKRWAEERFVWRTPKAAGD